MNWQAPTGLAAGRNVALVEDEPVLREELAFQLRHRGLEVETFDSAAAFYRFTATRPCAVAVLDIGLPGEDGLAMARHLREHDAQMGIVFLTARQLREDRLEGLSAGADAYLVKPVDIDELVLVLGRLLARQEPTGSGASHAGRRLGDGPGSWRLETATAALQAPDGCGLRLTLGEMQLLAAVMRKAGLPCSPSEIGRALGLLPDEWSRHRIEVIVSRLRQKVVRETGLELPLRTVRGQGYLWPLDG